MNVSEIRSGLEAGRQLELPLQNLPFVPIALDLGPSRIVGDGFHLVALAVDRARTVAIPVDHRIDVDVEPEHILVQE